MPRTANCPPRTSFPRQVRIGRRLREGRLGDRAPRRQIVIDRDRTEIDGQAGRQVLAPVPSAPARDAAPTACSLSDPTRARTTAPKVVFHGRKDSAEASLRARRASTGPGIHPFNFGSPARWKSLAPTPANMPVRRGGLVSSGRRGRDFSGCFALSWAAPGPPSVGVTVRRFGLRLASRMGGYFDIRPSFLWGKEGPLRIVPNPGRGARLYSSEGASLAQVVAQ